MMATRDEQLEWAETARLRAEADGRAMRDQAARYVKEIERLRFAATTVSTAWDRYIGSEDQDGDDDPVAVGQAIAGLREAIGTDGIGVQAGPPSVRVDILNGPPARVFIDGHEHTGHFGYSVTEGHVSKVEIDDQTLEDVDVWLWKDPMLLARKRPEITALQNERVETA